MAEWSVCRIWDLEVESSSPDQRLFQITSPVSLGFVFLCKIVLNLHPDSINASTT